MRRALALALAALLSACGGGSGGTMPLASRTAPAPGASPASARGTLQVTLVVPGIPSTATRALKHVMSAAASTQGAIFTIYAHGGSPTTPIVTTAVDVSATSPNCTAAGSGRNCTEHPGSGGNCE